MPRILNEREIADFLLEDIPSDCESVCSVEPEEDDNNDGSQSMMVLGDIPPELQPELDDGFTSDNDVPLSNLVLPSTSASHNQTEVVEPKWKRHYKMEEPSEYIGGGGVPTNIIDLENVTPTQLFRMFWSEDLVEIICFQTNLYATQKERDPERTPLTIGPIGYKRLSQKCIPRHTSTSSGEERQAFQTFSQWLWTVITITSSDKTS